MNLSLFYLAIKVEPLFSQFKYHIDLNHNSRILFSAPFGQGKTTFLDEFFKTYKNDYEIFRVYPVNYSVANNEDVFRYIKSEILFQLLGSGVEFEKEDFSFAETLPEFVKANPALIFGSFMKLLSGTGRNWYEIFEEIKKISKKFSEFGNNVKIDDKKLTEEYIKVIYEKEGSIFEEDIYTQIIRQLLEQLKLDSGKSNVLIIDDLDRMDPEHIFRILNVLSAHFDNHNYHFDGLTNKFSFDKIIIVCDLLNIWNIYKHRFGPDCDFTGYISKYYSIEAFNFDNKEYLIKHIESLRYKPENGSPWKLFKSMLIDFSNYNELSIRDLKNFQTLDLSFLFEGVKSKSYGASLKYNGNHIFYFFIIIHYLLKIFDISTLTRKINRIISKGEFFNADTESLYKSAIARYGYVSLAGKGELMNSNKPIDLKISSKRLQFHSLAAGSDNFPYYSSHTLIIDGDSNLNFTFMDYYQILLLNIERYIQLGGIKGKIEL